MPPEQSEDGVAFVADQLRELKKFLEDQTGKHLDEDRLKGVVARSKRTMDLLRACQVEKRSKTLTSDVTSELYEVYLTHSGMGSAAALRYAQQLLKDLKAAPAAHGIRLLWLHTIPNWQEPVRQMLNFNDRCQIVTCDTNFEGLVDMDPERPYESMARRLVYSQWNGRREPGEGRSGGSPRPPCGRGGSASATGAASRPWACPGCSSGSWTRPGSPP